MKRFYSMNRIHILLLIAVLLALLSVAAFAQTLFPEEPTEQNSILQAQVAASREYINRNIPKEEENPTEFQSKNTEQIPLDPLPQHTIQNREELKQQVEEQPQKQEESKQSTEQPKPPEEQQEQEQEEELDKEHDDNLTELDGLTSLLDELSEDELSLLEEGLLTLNDLDEVLDETDFGL